MTGIIVFAVAIAVVLATSLFKNVDMTEKAKNLIATVLSVLGGSLTVVGTHGWDFSGFSGADILATALIVYGAAQAIYQFILKGTSVEEKLEEVSVLPGGENG